jgi:hypothetical protein
MTEQKQSSAISELGNRLIAPGVGQEIYERFETTHSIQTLWSRGAGSGGNALFLHDSKSISQT